MDSTISTTFFALSKTLNSYQKPFTLQLHHHFSRSLNRSLQKRFSSGRTRCIINEDFHMRCESSSVSSSSTLLRRLYIGSPISSRLACVSSSAVSFTSNGGGDGFNGGNGGDGGDGAGDGGSNGGEIKSKSIAGKPEELSALSPDVIILDVGGMTCGGCAASVKRILESQPQVSSASVNLATETALVWPISEAKAIQNWQQQLGETLARHLTNCGFKSNLRGEGAIDGYIP